MGSAGRHPAKGSASQYPTQGSAGQYSMSWRAASAIEPDRDG